MFVAFAPFLSFLRVLNTPKNRSFCGLFCLSHHGDLLRALPFFPFFAPSDEPTAAKASKPTPTPVAASSAFVPSAANPSSVPESSSRLEPRSTQPPLHSGDTSIVPNPGLRSSPSKELSAAFSTPQNEEHEAHQASRRLFVFRDKQQDGKRHTGEFSMGDVSSWIGRSPSTAQEPFRSVPSSSASSAAYDFDEAPASSPPLAVLNSPDRLIGQQIGNFRILSCIGRGGFATVYKAEQLYLQQPFAIKVLHIDSKEQPDILERFRREAQALAQLRHSHVVQISDFGLLPDVGFYLVMEYLEGRDLHKRFQEEAPFSVERIARIIEQLCSVLDYIHRKGIIHRDLKPANIFLVQDLVWGEQAKLIDFGVASLMQHAGLLTQQGAYLGTARYVSPEQAEGAKDVDGRSDLYALGVILHWMLCGKHPFDGENPIGILYQQIHKPPPQLTQQAPQKRWSPILEEALQRCLAKNRNQRPQNATAFWEICKPALLAQQHLLQSEDSLLDTQAVPVQRPLVPVLPDADLRTLRNFSPLPDPLHTHPSSSVELRSSQEEVLEDSTLSSSRRGLDNPQELDTAEAQLEGTLSTTQDDHASALFSLQPDERTTKRASLRSEKPHFSRDEEEPDEGDSTFLEPLMVFSPPPSTPAIRVLRREDVDPVAVDAARTHVGPFPTQEPARKSPISQAFAFDGVDATLIQGASQGASQGAKRPAQPTSKETQPPFLPKPFSRPLLAGVSGFAALVVLWWIASVFLSKPTTRGESHSLLRPPPTSRSQLMSSNVQNAFCPEDTLLLPSSSRSVRLVCIERSSTTIPRGTPAPYAFATKSCSQRQRQICTLTSWKEACVHRKNAMGVLCKKIHEANAKQTSFVSTLCSFSSYHLSFTSHEILQKHQRYLFALASSVGTCQESSLPVRSSSLSFRCCVEFASPSSVEKKNP